MSTAPSNAAQERSWDGAEGGIWARQADLLEGVPARYDAALLDAAGLDTRSRVLDVGCGTGSITPATSRWSMRLTRSDVRCRTVAASAARAASCP